MARATCDRVAQQVIRLVQLVNQSGRWLSARTVIGRLREYKLKSLILAQNERWRRGLGMQVARET